MEKRTLLGMNLEEMEAVTRELGLPRFQAKQILRWIYQKRVGDIDMMSDLSLKAREALKDNFEVGLAAPLNTVRSQDGTCKYLFGAAQGHWVETVYIPDEDRATVCVSCQVGCKMNCLFCMTGKQGFSGNLTSAEIMNQILSLPQSESLTNLVFMGMGEPLDNLDSIMRTIEILTAPWGLAWSPRRITLSTCGLRKGLARVLDETDVNIAVSLHAPIPQLRQRLMPAEKAYSIEEVVSECRQRDFAHQRRLSFEYIVFDGVNDQKVHLDALLKLLRGLDCRMNLIRFHKIPGVELDGVSPERIVEVRDYLTGHGLFSTIRASRGEDVWAACGMLSTKEKEEADRSL